MLAVMAAIADDLDVACVLTANLSVVEMVHVELFRFATATTLVTGSYQGKPADVLPVRRLLIEAIGHHSVAADTSFNALTDERIKRGGHACTP